NLGPELRALLPWLFAALIWTTVLTPLRSEDGARLARQTTIRRERLRADRALAESQALKARMNAALGRLCLAPSDAAALRQRAVAATAGLPLSPLSLSVT